VCTENEMDERKSALVVALVVGSISTTQSSHCGLLCTCTLIVVIFNSALCFQFGRGVCSLDAF